MLKNDNSRPSTVPAPVPVPVTVTPKLHVPLVREKEIRIALPSLAEIYASISLEVHTRVVETLATIMDKIGSDYKIPPHELKAKYLTDLQITLQQQQQLQQTVKKASQNTKKARTPLDPEIRCMARTAGGEQCTRRRQTVKGIEYCGSHSANQPYGRIDESAPVVEKKKRGRPRKSDSPYAGETVELQFEIVMDGDGSGSESGGEYIRDQNGNVYEKPECETISSLGDLTCIGKYDYTNNVIVRS